MDTSVPPLALQPATSEGDTRTDTLRKRVSGYVRNLTITVPTGTLPILSLQLTES